MNESRLLAPRPPFRCGLPLVLCLLAPSVAGAHQETGTVGGFASGFLHPLTTPQHLLV